MFLFDQVLRRMALSKVAVDILEVHHHILELANQLEAAAQEHIKEGYSQTSLNKMNRILEEIEAYQTDMYKPLLEILKKYPEPSFLAHIQDDMDYIAKIREDFSRFSPRGV